MVSAVHSAILASRALVAVQGADTRDFLQGLISNDIRKVCATCTIYAALLSPQGKYLFDFIIAPWGEGVVLDVAASRADDFIKRLTMYRLRAQVTIERLHGHVVAARWGQGRGGEAGVCALNEGILSFTDPRATSLGTRLIGPREAVTAECAGTIADERAYDAHRLALAIPEGSCDMVVDRSLLLEFGFEPLHGVDFTKGCYVGQEVTARSKHRAQLRKVLHKVCADVPALPPAGTEIICDGKVAGEMRSSAGGVGLAVLSFDAVASGMPLLCGDVTLQAALPEWFDKALASIAD